MPSYLSLSCSHGASVYVCSRESLSSGYRTRGGLVLRVRRKLDFMGTCTHGNNVPPWCTLRGRPQPLLRRLRAVTARKPTRRVSAGVIVSGKPIRTTLFEAPRDIRPVREAYQQAAHSRSQNKKRQTERTGRVGLESGGIGHDRAKSMVNEIVGLSRDAVDNDIG
jgi:hypothetical protein